MLLLRRATADDYRDCGREPPAAWFGQVLETGDGRMAFGAVSWLWVAGAAEPRLVCWATLDLAGLFGARRDGRPANPIAPRTLAIVLHRRCLRALRTLRAEGEEAIYCAADPRMGAPARRWLERLGFGPDPVMSATLGMEVMRWPS